MIHMRAHSIELQSDRFIHYVQYARDSIEFIYIFECLYLHIFSSLRLSFRKHFILYVYLSIKSLVSQEMRWKWGEKLEKKGSLSKQSSTYSNIFTYFRSSPCILLIFSVLFSSSSGRRNGIWHSTDRKDDGTVRMRSFNHFSQPPPRNSLNKNVG